MTGTFVPDRKTIVDVLWKTAVLGGVVLLALARYFWGGECPVLHHWGIPCLSCGLTRAWIACLSGNVAGAFGYHFMFPAVPILALYFYRNGKVFPWRWFDRLVLGGIAAGFVLKFALSLIVCG
jgi:hypothetical protein